MATFNFTFQNGTNVSKAIPSVLASSCQSGRQYPPSNLGDMGAWFILHAGDTNDLEDKIDYLDQAIPVMQQISTTTRANYSYWRNKKEDCNSNNGLCWHCLDCPCTCDGTHLYCYESERTLEKYRDFWKPLAPITEAQYLDLLQIKADTLAQMTWDVAYAEELALVQQIIAETNNLISITAYENDVRETDATKKKAQDIFVPILMVLILVGLAMYYFKK